MKHANFPRNTINFRELIVIDIEIRKPNRIKEFFHKLHSRLEDHHPEVTGTPYFSLAYELDGAIFKQTHFPTTARNYQTELEKCLSPESC